jgi:hypothetical protein
MGALIPAVFRTRIKLKLFRGALFLNDTNCMDERDRVTVKPLDRISVAVWAAHHKCENCGLRDMYERTDLRYRDETMPSHVESSKCGEGSGSDDRAFGAAK